MNKLYVIGAIFVGIGGVFMYHAGIQDGKKELSSDTWTKATKPDDFEG